MNRLDTLPTRTWLRVVWMSSLAKKRVFVVVIASLGLAIILGIVLVPSLVAQVNEWSRPMIVFQVPGGHGQAAAISESPGYQPLNPTYLPEGQWQFSFGGSDEGGIKYLVLSYLLDKQFVRISQSKAPPSPRLPSGAAIQVKGQAAALLRGLNGTDPFSHLSYSDAKQITWYQGDARVDLLSNLAEPEMLRIADSLAAAEQRNVKFLSLPNGQGAPYPLNTPVLP